MASLTLDNVPDDLAARLQQRAARNGRSLRDEVLAVIAEVEQREAVGHGGEPVATGGTPLPVPADQDAALARIRQIQARFPGAAKAAQQPRDPEEVKEERELFARLRSQFKGPPLTSEEIIAAIGRESHPPELDRFGNRINTDS
jgi:plasmid stability protein